MGLSARKLSTGRLPGAAPGARRTAGLSRPGTATQTGYHRNTAEIVLKRSSRKPNMPSYLSRAVALLGIILAGAARGQDVPQPKVGDAPAISVIKLAAAADAGEGVQRARCAALVRRRIALLVPE